MSGDVTLAEAVGKYRLLGEIGTGGMADVFLAVADGPEGFRKLCVLKLLKEKMAGEPEYRSMFLHEARIAARMNHPNVVQTFEVGETHGRLMIAMEYVEGQPVNRIRRRIPTDVFPLEAYVGVLRDVLDALEYAHGLTDFDGTKLGIVHRDVSPQNIVVGYDARVKLVDFGIAKSLSSLDDTHAGVLKGKVGYMAPEQASMSDVDGRADIFSIGVILWEAIAGRRLSGKMSSRDVLLERVEGRYPRISDVVPDVDPRLAAICNRAMERLPEQRFASAAEFQNELDTWLKSRGALDRRTLSQALRDAFAADREQLRSIVEQRMADSSFSGSRPSLTLAAAVSRAPSLADGSMTPHSSAPPPSTVIPVVTAPPRRSWTGVVIVGVAASVAFGIGAFYASQTGARNARSGTQTEDAQGTSAGHVERAPSTAPSAAEPAVIELTSPGELPPVVGVAATGSARPRPRDLRDAGSKGWGAPRLLPADVNSAVPSAVAPPVKSAAPKGTSRTLDEKDPYDP
jgi:serine/threonine-protein kinase